jgi:hypothetical protein
VVQGTWQEVRLLRGNLFHTEGLCVSATAF